MATDPESILGSAPILAGMSRDDKESLFQMTRRLNFQKGDTVFKIGERGRTLFLVESGEVDVFRVEDDGRKTSLVKLRPGDTFGEVAMLDGGPRQAIGVATRDSVCLTLEDSGLQYLKRTNPAVAARLFLNIAQGLAERVVHAAEELDKISRRTGPDTRSEDVASVARRSLWDRWFGR
jgi:CRP-like cAMP-binding protein